MKFLFFLLLTFLIITSPLSARINLSGSSTLETLHYRTFKISAGNALILETESGDVTITSWEKNEVEVKVLGNERARERMTFSFNANDNKVEVKGKRDGSGWSWFSNLELKYEIKVPASFSLEVFTSGGDIKVGEVNGIIQLKTSGGDIWADRCTGSINTRTSGGDINIYTSNSPVDARTSGGDIELEYSGQNKGIELNTSGGDITVKVSADIKASVEMSTSGGHVSNSGINISDAKKMSRTKILGEINGGGEKLIARTSGGDVELKRLD
ncbi:MAG: DUF4097 domain-containing protein [Ignavibacteriaceae bacterium]|nr:DUF4097 domain-containing protein [Ignavibacteriaceae bacterium]